MFVRLPFVGRLLAGAAVLSAAVLGVAAAGPAVAQTAPAKPAASAATATKLTLTPGQPAAVHKGLVVGRRDVTYTFAAKKGQAVVVDLASANTAIYFNLAKVGSPEAIYASDRGETGNTATVAVPDDGEYQVQVYLFRNAARRGEKAPFTLSLSIK